MLISLQTVFSADAHLAKGQVLREEPTVKKGKCLKLRVGTRMPTVSVNNSIQFIYSCARQQPNTANYSQAPKTTAKEKNSIVKFTNDVKDREIALKKKGTPFTCTE
jgi:hypothetical protein